MSRLVIIIILFLCVGGWNIRLEAQDTLLVQSSNKNYRYESLRDLNDKYKERIDSISYWQYLEKDYVGLIETAKNAALNGVDFYYLTYRTAIAYYELKNYAKAIGYYRKALLETPQDEGLNSGLYYAYLLSGQRINADILWEENSKKKITAYPFKLSIINYAGVSGGYIASGNKETTENEQYQYRDMYYGDFKIGFNLNERWKLHLGAQFYNTDYVKYNQGAASNADALSQYAFIGAMDYTLNNSWQWGLAGAFYKIENNNKTNSGNGNGLSNKANFASAYSGLLFINKRFTYVQPEISGAFSNFGGYNQYQTAFNLMWYPLGNVDLYSATTGAFIYNTGGYEQRQLVFSEKIGLKTAKNLWLEGMASFGNHANYITNHAFLTYDTYDPIKLMAGATATYYFSHLNIFLTYQYQQREATIYKNSNFLNSKKYDNHLINLGLLWSF